MGRTKKEEIKTEKVVPNTKTNLSKASNDKSDSNVKRSKNKGSSRFSGE